MKKFFVIIGLLLAAVVVVAQAPIDFTPTSGIAWTAGGAFAIGMEAWFPAGGTADRTTPVPVPAKGVEVFGGTFTYRPKDPTSGFFGGLTYWKSAVLLRISVIGDPSNGDGGGGPGSLVLINQVINVNNEPVTVPIGHFKANFPAAPADGSPYQIRVYMGTAGAGWPTDAEIETSGRWF